MGSIIKTFLPLASLLSIWVLWGCIGDNDKEIKVEPLQPPPSSKSTELAEPVNGAIIFIDKSASLKIKKDDEIKRDSSRIVEKLESFLGKEGTQVTIYFIHKDLPGATPFHSKNLIMPSLEGLTALPKNQAEREYKKAINDIKSKIKEAILTPLNQSTSSETDLWYTLKKANDKFNILPSNGKRLLIYYSDMVESVASTNSCGKNYSKVKFKNVPDAVRYAKQDAPAIKKCYSLNKFSSPTEVYICFPTGSNEISNHPYMYDYWRALLGEFGELTIGSSL